MLRALSTVRLMLSELARASTGGAPRSSFAMRAFLVGLVSSIAGLVMGLIPSFVGLGVAALGGPGGRPSGALAFIETMGLSVPAKLGLAIALVSLAVAASFASSRFAAGFSAEATRDLRVLMMDRLLDSSPRDIEALGAKLAGAKPGPAPPGVVMKAPPASEAVKLAVLRDGQMAAELCVSAVSNLPQTVFGLVTLSVELALRGSGLVAAIGFAVFLTSRLLSSRSSKRISQRTKALSQADAAAFGEVSEKLTCLDDFRLAGATPLAKTEVGEALARAASEKKEVAKVIAESGQISSLVTTLAPLFVLVFLGATGSTPTPPEVAHLLVSLPLIVGRLGALDGLRLALVEKESVLESIAHVLALGPTPTRPDAGATKDGDRSIAFEGVRFEVETAQGVKTIVHDVSIDIPGGSVVGLCGPSGSGKSSLLRLLLRLDDPTAGRVHVFGRDLALHRRSELATLFGAELQSGKVLPRTVQENVLLQAASLDPALAGERAVERAKEALACAQIESLATSEGLAKRFVAVPPNLSGGEQKRVLVARAVASGAEVIVLDEPEAGLPDDTATKLFDAILATRGARSVIAVTHAPALFRSDFNVVMDQGRVVDVGPHAELLERCEVYRKLNAK